MHMDTISIKIITENSCIRDDLLAQHGLSIFVDYMWKKYLFDCGQVIEWLTHNLDVMNIKTKELDWIIISHPHHDHCWSLPKFISLLHKQNIYITPDFETKKYTYKNFIEVKESIEIEKWLFLIWPLWNKKGYKEQSLVIDLWAKGLVIIVWCSHPWIEHIVAKAQETTWNKKIMGIVGWLHFVELKDNDIEKKINYLKSLQLDFIAPGHCTWFEAISKMKNTLWNRVKISGMWTLWVWSTIQCKPKLTFDVNR